MVDSVLPIVDAGLQELVETDHRLTEEVMLFSTPGHSTGHVSVAIRSEGKKAAITGDLIHNPIQLYDPGICANFDFDQKVGLATRQAFIDDCPSSDDLRQVACFQKGGSGSSVIEIMRHAVDAASDGLRLSGV